MTSVDHLGVTFDVDRRTYQWDPVHNKTRTQDVRSGGPGTTHTYSYDSQYRLLGAQVLDGAGNILRDTDYVLDGVGNRVKVNGDSCAGEYVMDPTFPDPADAQMNQYTTTPCIGCIDYDRNGSEVLRGGSDLMIRDWRDQARRR